ncbi:MAG: AraC family transcriptional regulator [Victivallales bacterium]
MKNLHTMRKSITPIPYVGKGAVLSCVQDSPGLIVESHHHLYHEFDYIIGGRGEYAVGRKIFQVKGGDMVYIGRAIQHRRCSDISDPLVMCNLDVEDSMLMASENERMCWPLWKCWKFSNIDDPSFTAAVRTLMKLMPRNSKMLDLNRRQWGKIARGLTSILNNDWIMIGKRSTGLQDLAMRIRLSPEKHISLGEEAERLGISRHWLSRRFHSVFGVTMFEYRDLARTDRAVKALLSCGQSVEELGGCLGYSSKSHFINTFRRFAGCTPGIFRSLK